MSPKKATGTKTKRPMGIFIPDALRARIETYRDEQGKVSNAAAMRDLIVESLQRHEASKVVPQ